MLPPDGGTAHGGVQVGHVGLTPRRSPDGSLNCKPYNKMQPISTKKDLRKSSRYWKRGRGIERRVLGMEELLAELGALLQDRDLFGRTGQGRSGEGRQAHPAMKVPGAAAAELAGARIQFANARGIVTIPAQLARPANTPPTAMLTEHATTSDT
jgi:hypothetical protein